MYVVSLIIDVRLNTLTFIFLIALGTHNFAYVPLILLQLTAFIYFITIRIK